MKKIAFIGLGNMGLPMARNLLKAGHELKVFDLVQSAVDELVAEGAKAANDAHDAVSGVEIVVSMLPASRHVEGLYLGDDGLLAFIRAGTLVLECSTIAPDSARKVHAQAKALGIDLLDAPVSGGTAGAAGGTLTFMVGGDGNTLEKARPVLAAMGKNIFHAGPEGAGQVAKVCNNQVLAVQMIATAEAMALGVANGLDPSALAEIMRQSSGGNWVLERYNPWPGVMAAAPASNGYQGGFMAELMAKDLGLAQEAAQLTQNSTPMGALALQLYKMLLKQGKGRQDFSVVQQLFIEPEA
ncbi:NAD-dependent L-serine dehydrogenase [Pseudomonas solani]|uniref:3-hydroxyisobutyrate dehydrogenase n=1 Tax=Pseudomonas solani TaxID=2731552 RepID=A0ABM7L3N2_9PSED|nr:MULTISPECIES: 3-hydroxyisobutyrate dehydrogenase [Pseudomonas]EQM67424.1 3-hydroxyisobutyrate dehydrogenase [Pseudomonas alcaligenes OT 69]MDN4144770.1 3-hydroxyisobutyrate dehydrogenase [Pseudomonas tohonis]MCU9950501.1 3-hydroxyisobutyrate dehydrogenase [Pseudomonas sp. PDM13]MDU9414156.1 3-hydroxyisobutyrate dehydrogenase [Pseudomonas sp. zfem005]BCD84129.1 NAD-dependent L-serine dehydrogenase [Pseudomonas solani]